MSMCLEYYNTRFAQYAEEAKKLKDECKHLDELKSRTVKLSSEAAKFYSEHSDDTSEDYQQRVKIFIDFDNSLTEIKREAEQKFFRRRSSLFGNRQKSSESIFDLFTPSKSH